MRALFVINPEAGKQKDAQKMIAEIKASCEPMQPDFYITKAVGDGELYVREYCRANSTEELRIIACGGDGTFNEVMNGAIGFENVLLGIVPTGTGNDFCRNFPNAGDFMNAAAQLAGEAVYCDAIRYTAAVGENKETRYCANMFNIGFDCNVVDMTNSMKKVPLVSGSLAYLLSVFAILIRKKGADLKIEVDEETVHDGKLLLTSVANGSFCGGGVKSNPNAAVDDGRIDINIVNDVSRGRFIKLFPHYKKGTHMQQPRIEEVVRNKKCGTVCITARNGSMRLCTDGEITDADRVEFEVAHNVFRFLVPAKEYHNMASGREEYARR